MARHIVLDTETTGFDPKTGDRVVEIACVELRNLIPTGVTFHRYIDPERDMPADAERVHGLSAAFLKGKPCFHHAEVVDEFLDFVGEASIVAHNAPFDRGFVNFELERAGRGHIPESRWVDTLALARKRYPGAHNSLDALCKRFNISLAERTLHGALIDARLTASVYLQLEGGNQHAFALDQARTVAEAAQAAKGAYGPRPTPLAPRSTEAERAAHAAFVAGLGEGSVWSRVAEGA